MRSQNLPMPRREMRGQLGPFEQLQDRIDRMFDEFAFGLPTLRGMGEGLEMMPALDVHEEGDKVMINAELPGMDEKDIDISLEGDMLTISGEKKREFESKAGDGMRSERSYGRFSRSIRLPFMAEADKIDARYDKGVLKLSIERPANARDRAQRIAIHH